jgi:hypothetical protein
MPYPFFKTRYKGTTKNRDMQEKCEISSDFRQKYDYFPKKSHNINDISSYNQKYFSPITARHIDAKSLTEARALIAQDWSIPGIIEG